MQLQKNSDSIVQVPGPTEMMPIFGCHHYNGVRVCIIVVSRRVHFFVCYSYIQPQVIYNPITAMGFSAMFTI